MKKNKYHGKITTAYTTSVYLATQSAGAVEYTD